MEIAKNISLAIVVGILIYVVFMVGKIAIVGTIGVAIIYAIMKLVKFKRFLCEKWSDFRNKE